MFLNQVIQQSVDNVHKLAVCVLAIPLAKREQLNYLHSIETYQGIFHTIKCDSIFDDVIELYNSIMKEFPMRVKFDGEQAINAGGIARDMLSMFWKKIYTYMKMFDGGALLIPAVHCQVAMENFPTHGAILSHRYLVYGMPPA